VTELTNAGAAISPSGGYTGGGLSLPQEIALDGGGNVWITNYNARVSEFSNSGVAISPSTGYTSSAMANTAGVAIDGSGNVWISNGVSSTSLTELIGAAVPVITPIVAGLPITPTLNGTSSLATRP
jgi:hypothetical protein